MFVSVQSIPLEDILNHLILFNIKESKQVVADFFQHYETQLETIFILL